MVGICLLSKIPFRDQPFYHYYRLITACHRQQEGISATVIRTSLPGSLPGLCADVELKAAVRQCLSKDVHIHSIPLGPIHPARVVTADGQHVAIG